MPHELTPRIKVLRNNRHIEYMDNEHIKIIDFILTELNKKPRYEGDSIDSLVYNYQKETGIKQVDQFWDKIARICENDNLIEQIGNSSMHEITPKGIEILLEHGTYVDKTLKLTTYRRSKLTTSRRTF